MPEYHYYSVNRVGLPYFTVDGGPFAAPQTMGVHITDERGLTVAVSCSMEFGAQVSRLPALEAENERLRAALHRAICIIDSECDDLETIEELRAVLGDTPRWLNSVGLLRDDPGMEAVYTEGERLREGETE